MSDDCYVFLLVVFVLSVLILAAALIAGLQWWRTLSAVLTGTATGGSAIRERQRRMTERAKARRA
jgi:hypothetical protein